MALVNQAKREINAKIVYFGPGLSGKSTNLRHIYGKLKPEFRGSLKGMQVKDARMLFFDFTPPGDSSVHGFKVRFHVYTVSGEPADAGVWKMVLKGVDGVVFVADSSLDRVAANRDGIGRLNDYLAGHGLTLANLPAVFQYNKSDLPDALPAADLERMLNSGAKQGFSAVSRTGDGVLQTLLALVKSVLIDLRRQGIEGIAGTESVKEALESAAAPVPQREEAAPVVPAPAEPAYVEEESAPAPGVPFHPLATPEEGAEVTGDEPLSLELAGSAELSSGVLRLPLVIRSGARSKTVTLTLSVSEE